MVRQLKGKAQDLSKKQKLKQGQRAKEIAEMFEQNKTVIAGGALLVGVLIMALIFFKTGSV